MLISRKWLSQYMDISDLDMQTIATKITDAGLEVEGIHLRSQGTKLIIGEVINCAEHPNSDHLHVCQVNLGQRVEQIVCGAPNVAAGQKVIVAQVGAQLPGGEIKASVIRGEASNGMICSLLELGVDPHSLSEESKNGIEVLAQDAPVGHKDPLGYLGLDDEILDVGLTPNRSDCMAAWAMALEVGAILNRPVHLPDCKGAAKQNNRSASLRLTSETAKCPLFMGKVIHHVVVQESPKWMQERLAAAGVKSINNVVDITNYVMLEYGCPLHAFDFDKLDGYLCVRRAEKGEKLVTLDEVERTLTTDSVLIATEKEGVCLGGVFGGANSEIDNNTTSIALEAAYFTPATNRKSARSAGYRSEASARFERGIDTIRLKES